MILAIVVTLPHRRFDNLDQFVRVSPTHYSRDRTGLFEEALLLNILGHHDTATAAQSGGLNDSLRKFEVGLEQGDVGQYDGWVLAVDGNEGC